MRVERWLAHRARSHGERTALIAGGQKLSYAELEQRCQVVASQLSDAGVTPRSGVRIGIAAGNSGAWIETLHAAMMLGSPILALNTRLSARELERPIRAGRPGLIVCDPPRESTIRQAAPDIPILGTATLASNAGVERATQSRLEQQVDLAAEQSLLFTSGTSGVSKGVVLSYANQLASALASRKHLGVHQADRWLLCLPLFHVGGMAIPLRACLDAQSVVLHDGFDAERVAAALFDQDITLISLVSTMLHRLLEVLPSAPPALRCALIGGGPIPAPLLERARALGLPVAPTYGLTESASQVATANPLDHRSGVPPLPGTEIQIRAENGEPLAAGEAGEICVRGDQVMTGYLGDSVATRQALQSGWLRTGDVGFLDPAGRLHLLDRRSDLIVTGGENVYPSEVESALLRHPQLRDAAVVSKPDAEWGQRVVAHVVLGPDEASTAQELERHCREQLAAYKIPREFHFHRALPRSAGGKLLRRELRDD